MMVFFLLTTSESFSPRGETDMDSTNAYWAPTGRYIADMEQVDAKKSKTVLLSPKSLPPSSPCGLQTSWVTII